MIQKISDGTLGRAEIQSTLTVPAAAPLLGVSENSGRLRFFESSWREMTNHEIILQFVQGNQILFLYKVLPGIKPKVPNFTNTEFRGCFAAIKDLIDKSSASEC